MHQTLPCRLFHRWVFCSRLGKKPKFHNHDAPRNLKSGYDMVCIGADKVKSKYRPIDFYQAMSTCVRSEMYKVAVFLLAVADAYSRFDTLRVADCTAHQAAILARMQALSAIDKDKQTTLQENVK